MQRIRALGERSSGSWIPLALALIAEVVSRAGDGQSDTLAAPSRVLAAFAQALQDGSMLAATKDTLATVFGGLAVGGMLGLVFGLVLGSFPRLDKLFSFPIETIRPIPSVALIPIAMTIAGFGYSMEIAIVAFAVAWPMLISTRAAIAEVEPRLLEVAHVLRLGFLAKTCKIIIPASLPRIFVGLRLATGVALIVAVTVEIAANPIGLGYAIMMAQQSLRPALMLAVVLWIGIVGVALNSVLMFAQKRLFGRAGDLGNKP
jgi:ABC-type nitrate/sulfonate/bicarbonate transport system permease component